VAGGGTVFKFREFADQLNENQSVYGLEQPSEITGMKAFPKTVEGIAAAYINEILIQNPEGPYALSGHCLGGIIAYEMAKQLEASGREVKVLALFDTVIYEKEIPVKKSFKNFYQVPLILKRFISRLLLKLDFEIHLFRKYPKHAIGYKVNKLKSLKNKFNQKQKDEVLEVFNELEQNFIKASKKYLITPYDKE
jgi:thioesterase domain-containing protein